MRLTRFVVLCGAMLLLPTCFAPPPTPAWHVGRDVGADGEAEAIADVLADQRQPDGLEAVEAPEGLETADPAVELVDVPDAGEGVLEVEPSETADAEAPCEVLACDPASFPELELGPCERLVWAAATCTCHPEQVGQGEACDDGDLCTVDDACTAAGACVGTANPCSEALDTDCRRNRCDPASGACHLVDLPNDAPCDDGDPCTLDDHCQAGQCQVGTPNACDASADACNVGACVPETGACQSVPAHEGDVCAVADPCVAEARCAAGQCLAWLAVDCADDDPCTVDACNSETGACSHVLAPTDASELCNGLDDDCDGLTDEELVYLEPAGEARALGDPCEGLGVCGPGTVECASDGAATCSTNANGSEAAGLDEVCNGLDDDCDGVVDDGLAWQTIPVGEPCDGEGACGEGVVECATDGVATCSTNAEGSASEAVDEVCNGVDDDCDGVTDDGLTSADSPCRLLGVCSGGAVVVSCQGEAGWSCDYSVVEGFQAGDEAGRCDGLDNDCDGATDEEFPGLHAACDGPDADQCATGHLECLIDGSGTSCVDDLLSVEICDGIDNDCDGATDEEGAVACLPTFRDDDGDGYGLDADVRCLCAPDPDQGYTASTGGDCDDHPETGAQVHPMAAEVCNGVDDDCDGLTDAHDSVGPADGGLVRVPCALQQGVCAGALAPLALCVDGAWQPCHADDYGAYAPAFEADLERSCDGLDNDCDGATDDDFALALPDGGQAYGTGVACGRGRCAGGLSVCKADGSGVTCSTVGDAVPETCDGQDDDCDGLTDAADPDLALTDRQRCENELGACAGAQKPAGLCIDGGWAPCRPADYAAASAAFEGGVEGSCDGVDNDCDGTADEDLGLSQADGTTLYGPGRPCGVGACAGGLTSCRGDGSGLECIAGDPTPEECNGLDDDCDGLTDALDQDLPLAPCELQAGVCAGATHAPGLCQFGSWAPCAANQYLAVSSAWQDGAESACDGLDNDCDGVTDDDFAWTGVDGTTVVEAGHPCGTGACDGGLTVCDLSGAAIVCDREGWASDEVCNGVDDDCDGLTDEDLDARSADAPCLFAGVCSGGHVRATCAGGIWTCDYSGIVDYEADLETWCDGVDNDCDGQTDEHFALPSGATVGQACVGGGCAGVVVCAPTADDVVCSGDVGLEVCNGKDDDCDGATDEGLLYREPVTGHLLSKGAPCQGRGICGAGVVECGLTGVITCSTNPDGSASQVAPEVCNGQDDDCDGDVDDGLRWRGLALFASCDGEGACGLGKVECGVAGTVTCSTNPDGSTPQAKPEACDGKDDDCNGLTDAADPGLLRPLCDLQLGVCAGATELPGLCVAGAWAACDAAAYRAHAAAYEPAVEVACDGLDNDCDGLTDEDFELTGPDGSTAIGVGVACGVGACAGGVTVCRADRAGLRCSSQPAAGPEVCNGVDDDCDGLTDAADGADLLANDRRDCALQAGVCTASVTPAALCRDGAWADCSASEYLAHDARYQDGGETTCDGVDNDCDGVADDDFELTLLDGSLVRGVAAPCGTGRCAGGLTGCNAAGDGLVCPTEAAATPERCNATDDDCDGKVDGADPQDLLAHDLQLCANQEGVCAGAAKPAALCEEGRWGACTLAVYAAHDPAFQVYSETSCDDLDNDCDALVDEDLGCPVP